MLFFLISCLLLGVSAMAQDAVETLPSLNKTLVADLAPEIRVILEGEELTSTKVSKDDSGGVYVRAEPIFDALNDQYEFNIDEGVLVVHRSQDGVVMELYTDTGIVKANGRALGKLETFGEVREGMINLTPNAIAVLSGAVGKIDEETRVINFELDPRLKVATGFEIFVNEIPLGHVEPGPKSIGSVLLMPLRPIAKELGHELDVLDGGTSVRIRRSQDSAVFELNLDTGLIKLNGRPHGITKDVTYIEKLNLLLPVSAIEAMTGTHISVEGGTSRINIVLDDRLTGAIEPGERVDELAKTEPFVLETLRFHTGTDTLNQAELDFRVRGSNGRLKYEIPDLPTSLAEAQPAWLSLDFIHSSGAKGAIGDYSADYRELEGVGLHRIRGAALAKKTKKGRWAAAIGAPIVGSNKISDDQARPEYAGLAAGVRYADKKGWEAGLSYKNDGLSDDQMAVLTAISGRLGRDRNKKLNWDLQADIGTFSGEARAKSVDLRVAGNARYEINRNINIDAFASYDGAEFLRSDLDAEDRQDQIIADDPLTPETEVDVQFVPDVRERGQDHLSIGAGIQVAARKDIGIFNRPAASLRMSHSESGMSVGSVNKKVSDNYGAAISTSINPIKTNLSVDWNGYSQKSAEGSNETGNQISARIYKDMEYLTARAQFRSDQKNDDPRTQRLDVQLSAKPSKIALPKSAQLSISPSVSATWTDNDKFVRGGVVANLDSGRLLGKKTKLNASLGVLQSFSGNAEDRSDTFLTVGIGRQLPINKNLQLGLSYRNDLRGEQRVGIFLDGHFDFNEKRKFKKTQDGRGVLKGRAFLDKNRDGIRQEDEPGIGGALIRIRKSGLALRTDASGYYTIQNIKEGLHEIQVDNRSLPLGFALADNAVIRATIREGHVTDVQLAIVQRGQVRGFAFVDSNGDGELNKGEVRLEGAKLALRNIDQPDVKQEVYATSFGQFAFGDLPSGRYALEITKTNRSGAVPNAIIEIDLAKAPDLMARINIAAVSDTPIEMAEQDLALGIAESVIKGAQSGNSPAGNPGTVISNAFSGTKPWAVLEIFSRPSFFI